MINLEFHMENGGSVMAYDVHPRSQDDAIPVPAHTVSVTIWIGIK